MQAPYPCPQCGQYKLYRSRSRNHIETLIKVILPYKTYRCHACNWRGWISKRKASGKGSLLKSVVFYICVFIIAVIVAGFVRLMIA